MYTAGPLAGVRLIFAVWIEPRGDPDPIQIACDLRGEAGVHLRVVDVGREARRSLAAARRARRLAEHLGEIRLLEAGVGCRPAHAEDRRAADVALAARGGCAFARPNRRGIEHDRHLLAVDAVGFDLFFVEQFVHVVIGHGYVTLQVVLRLMARSVCTRTVKSATANGDHTIAVILRRMMYH